MDSNPNFLKVIGYLLTWDNQISFVDILSQNIFLVHALAWQQR